MPGGPKPVNRQMTAPFSEVAGRLSAAAISQIRIYKNGRGIWPECGAAVNSALVNEASQTHISHSKSVMRQRKKSDICC
jgi:hypothetical protein